jgi:hypothetical protein
MYFTKYTITELFFRVVKSVSLLAAAIIFFWIFIWDISIWNKSFETAFMGNGNGFLLIIVICFAAIADTFASRVDEIFEPYFG